MTKRDPKFNAPHGPPQPPKGVRAVRDSFENVVTGLGIAGKDKRESAVIRVDVMDYNTISALYAGNDLAATIVDTIPDDMLREGVEVRIAGDEKMTKAANSYLDELGMSDALAEGLKFERAYGGALILIGANDGLADLSQPLAEDRIQSIDYLNVFDASEAQPVEWQSNPAAADFAQPVMFAINPQQFGAGARGLQRVHASRCIVLPGRSVNRQRRFTSKAQIAAGWGDSVLTLCAVHVRDFDQAWGGVMHTLTDFAQGVLAIQGFAAALAGDKDRAIRRRMKLMMLSKSTINTMLIDKDGESYERKGTPLTGVAEALESFKGRLAAAARMPQSKLFGDSPSGLNSNGNGEDRAWYDVVKAHQRKNGTPRVNRLARLMFLAKDGPSGGKEPESWSTCWPALWQQTDGEKAATRKTNAESDRIYFDMGVASSEDIAQSRFGGDEYGMDLSVDLEAVAEREEQAAEDREAQAAALEAAARNPPAPGTPAPAPVRDALPRRRAPKK